MKFFIPNPGDTVPVRLSNGRVKNAKYIEPAGNKEHLVMISDHVYLASNIKNRCCCRIVGPSCDLVPS